MADVGYLALLLGLIISIYSCYGFWVGARQGNRRLLASAEGGALAAAMLATVAGVILIYFLMTSDFSILYVWQYTSTDLPLFYKFSALWAGNAGSLLLWVWILTIYWAVVAHSSRFQERLGIPYVAAILAVNSAFFFFLLAFIENPFARVPGGVIPAEGNGLNPLLQNPGMVFHPVTLYLGYVGFAIPYAYAMGALIVRRVDDLWIKVTRRWIIIAWLFLTLGNLYGAQWAYVELGWGGYWGWDPVENASFIPWLTGTAFLHSVMVQERKDMLKTWNVLLIIITYALTIFGTFLVRSGVLTSVHAFAGSNLGSYLFGFMGIMLAFSLYLLVDRMHLLQQGQEFESYLSKEASFLVNNLLLVGAAFATFWGTIFPLISEAVRGVKVTVGAPYFEQVNGPILLAVLFVLGVCPLIAWRRANWNNLRQNFQYPVLAAVILGMLLLLLEPGIDWRALLGFTVAFFVLVTIFLEFYRGVRVRRRMAGDSWFMALVQLVWRNRRRYGGYVVHLGVVLIAFGVVGSTFFTQQATHTVTTGEVLEVGDYRLTYQGIQVRPEGANTVYYAELSVQKDGEILGVVRPEKVEYANWPEMSTEVAILGGLREDLYVILAGWSDYGREATIEVHVNPLVSWLWIGGYVMVLGTLLAIWPGRTRGLVAAKYLKGV